MLLNIAPASRADALRILTLLCFAKRPLTIPELIDAIAVELGDSPRFNPDRRLETMDEIHKVCPGFIEVDEPLVEVDEHLDKVDRFDDVDELEDYDESVFIVERLPEPATVRIAHFSVQEYLESDRILHRKAAEFGVRKREAHTEIACICLTYLLEPALSTSMNQLEEYPLAKYATKTWYIHHLSGDQSDDRVQRQALRLFQNAAEFNNWVKIYEDGFYPGRVIEMGSPVYCASFLGLDLILSKILDGSVASSSDPWGQEVSSIINAQSGFYGNALCAAIEEGHESTSRLLIEKGANVNADKGLRRTALRIASANGHKAIVELLIEKGADIHAGSFYSGTALYTAAERGHKAIVELLIEKGAAVNVQGGYYRSALLAAAYRNHEDIMKLLIENGADINAQTGEFGTALQGAAHESSEATLKLLIENGADINAQGGLFGTALAIAATRSSEAIVKLLIENGADINAQAGKYGTALATAASQGFEAIVKLLIENGADVNAEDVSGTALCAAAAEGHKAIVKLLIEKGADVNIQGERFRAALAQGERLNKLLHR
jgi:ankyrin repeat protein